MRNAYVVKKNKIAPFKSPTAVKVYDQMCDELVLDWIITEQRYKFPTEPVNEIPTCITGCWAVGWMDGQSVCSLFHGEKASPSKALHTHRLLFFRGLCPLILSPSPQLSQSLHRFSTFHNK